MRERERREGGREGVTCCIHYVSGEKRFISLTSPNPFHKMHTAAGRKRRCISYRIVSTAHCNTTTSILIAAIGARAARRLEAEHTTNRVIESLCLILFVNKGSSF